MTEYKDILNLDDIHENFELVSGGVTVDKDYTIIDDSYDTFKNEIIDKLRKRYGQKNNNKGLIGYKKYIEIKKHNEEYASQNFMNNFLAVLATIITIVTVIKDFQTYISFGILIVIIIFFLVKSLKYDKKKSDKVFVYNEIIAIIDDIIANGFPENNK